MATRRLERIQPRWGIDRGAGFRRASESERLHLTPIDREVNMSSTGVGTDAGAEIPEVGAVDMKLEVVSAADGIDHAYSGGATYRCREFCAEDRAGT
jgi:hypothetical protein